MSYGQYDDDVLAGDWRGKKKTPPPKQPATRDLVVEHVGADFAGAVIRVDGRNVELEDWKGRRRTFPLGAGFLLEGTPVELVAPAAAGRGDDAVGNSRTRTASGSFAVADAPARVARASRIFVEGRHDAELVEKVWGADLRVEGVVVEYLEGVDHLDQVLADFKPSSQRRVGVLVDHLVPGSKESRIAEQVMRGSRENSVLIVGHPYVDVWQGVKPQRLGISAWPSVSRSVEWKHGICAAFGWPHKDQADIARAWRKILGQVRSYNDLEPELLGRVEQLIDFVTVEQP